MIYMPLTGGIIGAIMWLLYDFLYRFDPLTGAVVAILAEGVITGGLHLDGLADTFDGFYSNKGRAGVLRVMEDSRLGTHGVLALTGDLLLKVFLVNALARPEALFVMSVFSRLSMVCGAAFSKSAKDSGLGHMFIQSTKAKDALIAGFIAIFVTFYISGLFIAITAATVMFGTSLIFIRICNVKIGGMTGDTLGALGEVASLMFLTVYHIFSFYSLC